MSNNITTHSKMAGSKSKTALQPLPRSKNVTNAKNKKAKSVQRTMDAFCTVNTSNPSQCETIDYKAPISTEGSEWVDVDSDGDSARASQSQPAVSITGKSWADVVLPQISSAEPLQVIGLGSKGVESLQHKRDIPLVFLSYAHI